MEYKIKPMMAIGADDLCSIVHPNVLPQYCALFKLPLSFELSSYITVLLVSNLPSSDGILDMGGQIRSDVPFGIRAYLRTINSTVHSCLNSTVHSCLIGSSYSRASYSCVTNTGEGNLSHSVDKRKVASNLSTDSEPISKKLKEDTVINDSISHGPCLFRGDSRAPNEIFLQGFENYGDKDRIIEHVEGLLSYSGSRDSAFVSTSKSKNFTVTWLSEGRQAGLTYYVYEIRPTNNFYDLEATLKLGYQTTGREAFRNAQKSFASQQEVVAFGGIAKEQIIKAYEYQTTGKDSAPRLVRQIENPNYQHEASAYFSEPYPHTYQDDFYDSDSSCSESESESEDEINA